MSPKSRISQILTASMEDAAEAARQEEVATTDAGADAAAAAAAADTTDAVAADAVTTDAVAADAVATDATTSDAAATDAATGDATATDPVAADAVATDAAATDGAATDDATVSTEGFGGAVKNYLLNSLAVAGGAIGGGLAGAGVGAVVGGPAGAVIGGTAGYIGGAVASHAAFSKATAAKALSLKKQIESITKRIADAKRDDLEEAKKKGIRLTASDKAPDSDEVLKGALLGYFVPFYNAYQGHKAEELQKELQNKLGELKGVLEAKGVDASTESIVQLAYAMEAEGIDPDAILDDASQDASQDAAPDTVEAAVSDAVETEADVDTQTDAVSELEDVQDGLEALALTLESAIAQGGMTPQTSQMFNIAYESYSSRLGIETKVPSMESYGGQTSRVQASMEALADVKAKLQQIWEAIKAIIGKVRDAIVKFFSQIVTAGGRLSMRAERVKARAEKAKGSPKSNEVELGTLASKIAIGKDIKIDGLAQIEKLVAETCSFDETASKALLEDGAKIAQAAQSGERLDGANKLAMPMSFKKDSGDGKATDVLPGNVFFSLTWRSLDTEKASKYVGDKGAELAAKFYNGWSISKETSKQDVATDLKTAVLTPAQIGEVAGRCMEIGNKIKSQNALISDETKKLAGLLKQIKFNKDLPADKAAGVKEDIKAFQKRVVASDQASVKVLAYAVSAAGAYLTLAEKSLAQYSGAAAEEAKA